ncbi:SH3 domain-containing protein [Aurantiacibacter xanthus]|uniref:SH3 domain-containing protein n=1 Tax=Aurantiacibacter xanthus TaxID=1784712 RepID=A0A3A1PCE0_9SPHN|nr:SH3 domain-containing protein [Aurantiacibacter xanthus]RIV91436.1 SH3 domain-containing protein [Aurantiacibacter xanthus]
MHTSLKLASLAATATLVLATASPALADEPVQLVKCEVSLGSIALVDSPNAGWSQWNLGSPRQLLTSLATESGCFTPHNGGTEPARFLVTAVAGSQEEVDQSVEFARGAAAEALVRSGAATSILRSVPFGGAALGMLGGLGGRRTTVAAGLTVVNPATGQPLAAGTGTVTSTTLNFRGSGGTFARGLAETSGYAGSSEGRKLTEAFVIAFNSLVAQGAALTAAPASSAAPAAATAAATVAVDTVLRTSASSSAGEVRALRAGTTLTPTGQRDGLWIEAEDSFGTRGWVSVEDLQ